MYAVTGDVYLDGNGRATFERNGQPVLVRGAVISTAQATELGLPELVEKRNAARVAAANEAQQIAPKKTAAATEKTSGKPEGGK